MLRYSEIPRDISADSLATLKLSEGRDSNDCKATESDGPQPYSSHSSRDTKSTCSSKHVSRKISAHSISGGPGPPPFSYYNYGAFSSVPVHVKTQSLPNHSSSSCAKNYSCVVFDTMHVSPEEFAAQLTLLDLPIFLSIQPDELTSCAWNKKNKLTVAPNVVAFTRRFNHVSFWTVILSRGTPKILSRVPLIISALQSASVYRLSKTWNCLSKKDRQTFDRLADVFSESENWSNLRSHIESLKLPCIPYLGLYLTDLVYIDVAHPHSGGLESQQRSLKMNNILRIISNYQLSDYSHLTLVPHVQDYLNSIRYIEELQKFDVQDYLNSIRYIEELQKFVEDDQYKLSLKLEPPSPVPSSSSCSSKESVIMDAGAIASLNLSPAKASSGSLRLHAVTSGTKFIPGHRKCRSLGTNIFSKTHYITFDPKDLPKTLHLLDDSELEESIPGHDELHSPASEVPLQASKNTSEDTSLLTRLAEDAINGQDPFCPMQGCIRRKTVLKHGRKPTVTSWQRYWIQIWASSLAYFSPKSFKGNQRSDFKSEPSKMISLVGCQILLGDNTLHPDLFQIIDPARGNVYKFRAGSQNVAEKWCRYLQKAASSEQTPLPTNLMSFE
ncbi:RasGEF domain [Popillia japonica]|uniref:RasGEF domain n=1 Tax=Popillia japonica TaxID=7064 RepID=A0AAW1N1C7_POPJA